MGDMRNLNGVWEHQIADKGSPEVWIRVGYDDKGNPAMLYTATGASVSVGEDGNLIFAFGGHRVSAPPSVAVAINDALAVQVPLGKGKQVKAVVDQIEAQIGVKKAELAAIETEIAIAAQKAAKPPESAPVPPVVAP